jgi:penicillin-binding protein 1A
MAARPTRHTPPSRGGFAAFLIGLGKVVGALVLLGLIALGVSVAVAMGSLPSFDEFRKSPNGQSVEIRAADNSVLVSLGPSYGEWLPFARIPHTMTAAMVAVEDRRFYSHPGVDPIGIARSLAVAERNGHFTQGASTITQQLARNVFLTSNRTFSRKIREVVLSLAIERKFTKDAILELYLNRVYFGGGAYGIDAASRKFFGHPASTLSLPEAAIIAGLVKAPSRYAPSADPIAARNRAATVIATMADSGAITPGEAAAADLNGLKFAPQERTSGVRYFTDYVLAQVENLTDEAVEPLSVLTTLDPADQHAAEAAIVAEARAGVQGALVSMARDGAIKAMVGGRDYVASNYNRAVAARRQPGSSWKLFDYLAAIESGVEPGDTIVDAPITIDGWSPKNFTPGFAGTVTVREAFARSINTVAVRLAQRAGFDTVADIARRFGITTPIDTRPAMSLGASDVTLIELTAAYAAIANEGIESRPYSIRSISTASGKQLYTREAPEARVLVAPYVAAKMTDLLKAAVETGTGRNAQIGRPLAGKTGTTSSNKDGWFVGFTGQLTTGVWMGRDDAKPVPVLQGGRAPARAFAAYMARAVGGTPPSPLTTDVAAPDLGLEPDDQVYGISGDSAAPGVTPDRGGEVDLGTPRSARPARGDADPALPDPYQGDRRPDSRRGDQRPGDPPRLDDRWLDKTLNGPPQN